MMYNCNIFLFVLVGFFHFFAHFFIYFFMKTHKKQDFLQSVSLSQKMRIKYTNISSTNKTKQTLEVKYMKYVCDVCGWEYDEETGAPEAGIPAGTKFEDLPEDFECPLCLVGKDEFSEV